MERKTNRREDAFNIVLAIVGLIVLGVVFKQSHDNFEEMKKVHQKILTETIPLQSINITNRVSVLSFNYFTYGIGQIDEKIYYVAYKLLEDGGKQLYKMPAESTVIYETLGSDDQAYVEVDIDGYGIVKARRLYVPENSIEQRYDLTLE